MRFKVIWNNEINYICIIIYMENEIQIFRSNNVVLTVNAKSIIKVDAGIYDLDFSGV